MVGGVNQHVHWLLETKKYSSDKSFRNALLKAVPSLKGNGSYGVSPVRDRDALERYQCKGERRGDKVVLYWSNSLVYTPARVLELHNLFWDTREELKKKRKAAPMLQYTIDECKRLRIDAEDRRLIAGVYVDEMVHRGKALKVKHLLGEHDIPYFSRGISA